MDLTKYWATDILRVKNSIGGRLAYNPSVLRKYKIDTTEECDGLNHAEVLIDPICEGAYLTLKQDLPWGGTDLLDSSIAIAFAKCPAGYFVVNTWFGRPVLVPGSEWEKHGFRLESDSYGSWELVSQCTIDGLINSLLKLETQVNEKWRELKRMKISRHQREIKEAAYGFER